MAIGTAAAIGLGVAGIGSAVGGASNRKAANRTAQISQQATDQSIGLQRESRDLGLARLDPYSNRGNVAGNAINALLGLGGGTNASNLTGGPGQVDWGAYVRGNPDALANWDSIRGNSDGARFGGDINAFGAYHYNDDGARRDLSAFTVGGGAQTPANALSAQQAQQGAFDTFRNSTGYQFRVNEGMDALNSGFAGSGLLQSGAALRGLDDYRQNMASAELGNYLALLSQQQGVGAGAASASAGVSQNFANNAGSLITNNANNQANAAIARAQNNPFANALGTIGGGVLGFGR